MAGAYAFLAAGNAGIAVLDISKPLAPRYAASVNIDGYVQSVTVADHHLIAGVRDRGLQLFDISGPAAHAA